MRSTVLALLVALPITMPIAGYFAHQPAPPIYPDRCSYVKSNGQVTNFCVKYNPARGRYENPPVFVPSDFLAVSPGTATTGDYRYALSAVAFAVVFFTARTGLTVASRRRQRETPGLH